MLLSTNGIGLTRVTVGWQIKNPQNKTHMKINKPYTKYQVVQMVMMVCSLTLAVMPGVSQAQSIGVNFAGRQWSIGGNTPMTLQPLGTAGVVPQQNWNNVFLDAADSGGMPQLNIGGANAGVVSDNSGAATSVSFSYTQGGNATEWAADQATHTGNQQLLDGYWDVQSASGAVNLGNISYSMYDVYVYISADSNGRTAGVNINDGPQTYLLTDASGYNYSQPLIQATATSQGSATSAQYVLYQDVTGSSLQVDLANYGNDVGIAGIQVVGVVPEPSTLTFSIAGLALIGLIRGRELVRFSWLNPRFTRANQTGLSR